MKKNILVIAPHPDDETIGVGGAITKFAEQGHSVFVLVISGHLPPLYTRNAYDITVEESKKAFQIMGVTGSKFLEIPATMIGDQPISTINSIISDYIREINPQIVLCPYPDRHIDHRLVFESIMVATRPVGFGRDIELIAAYETLSETHWNAPHIEPNFVPNWVVDITNQITKKIEALSCYKSQISPFPGPRSLEAVEALAKFRGTQAGFAYGEGFHVIRMIG
jgi:LmbE family N-acetylglucosaminyl deacetylase